MLARLRRLSEEGRAFFVLAGFWQLHRAITYDYQSPLRNFGEPLPLGGLEPEACVALATRPMAALGLSYAEDGLPERIATRTGGRPNLIAIVCGEIVGGLGAGDRAIGAAAVEAALGSDAVRQALSGWEALADGAGAGRLDRIVVYATAGGAPFTPAELQQRLHALGAPHGPEEIAQSLARLDLAFILGRGTDGRYRYRVPLFVEMVREMDLDLALAHALQASPADAER